MADTGLDAILFDIGGTLVAEAPPGTSVRDLQVVLLPGAVEGVTLAAEHARVGAVTNTSVMREAEVRALLVPCGIDALLEVVVTSVDVDAWKPDPRPVLVALEQLEVVDAARAVLVGDTDADRDAAAAAGVRFASADGVRPVDAIVAELLGIPGSR